MYDPCVKVKEETNREKLMKGENTKSLGKIVWNFMIRPFKWLFTTDGGHIILVLLVVISIFVGCVKFIQHIEEKDYPYGEYEMTFRVYYTEHNIKEYTVTHNRPIYMRSNKGTNEIHKYDGGNVIETSAPIEIVRYVNKAK